MEFDKQDNNSIRPAVLLGLYNIGFKLVPLAEDSKTPCVPSTNEIYNNPDYWNAEKLVQESHKFNNAATVFGKTRNGLYLNELDIDSQKVYDLLFGSSSFIDNALKNTYVVKTKKPTGYRIFWLSDKQNNAIGTKACKPGYEFEIKTDNTLGHSTLVGIHRDDPNFHYENYGQNKLAVMNDLYDKLVELLAPECLLQKTEDIPKPPPSAQIELADETIEYISSQLCKYYVKGQRDNFIYALCGVLHKSNVSKDSALNLVQILAKDDEEVRSRIDTVEQTYSKDPRIVSGNKYFLKVLEHATGDRNTAKALIQNIFDIIDSGTNSDLLLRLADTIMKEYTFKTMTDNRDIYVYDGSKYTDGQEWRIDELCRLMHRKIKTHEVQEVINNIKGATYTDRELFDADTNLRNTINGVLNIHTKEITPHSADYLSITQLPVKYDPQATCPKIEKFLKDVLRSEEDIKFMLQLIGYCLLNDCRYQVSIMLYGNSGANGKGTLLDLITAFLGADNCSHRSLQSIDTNRFAVADLFAKMANTYADLKSTKLSETGNYKMLVAGDWITGEFKNKNAFKFRNKAKLWFSANEIPESDDKTDAYYRRWLIFHLDKRFIQGKENVNQLAELTTPAELSGLLNLALDGLRDLSAEGGFHYKTIEDIRRDYEIHTNDVNAFLEEECLVDITDQSYSTLATDVYAAYVNFCVSRKTRPIDMNPFGKKLSDKGIYNQRHREQGQSEHYYDGLILRKKLTGEDQTQL